MRDEAHGVAMNAFWVLWVTVTVAVFGLAYSNLELQQAVAIGRANTAACMDVARQSADNTDRCLKELKACQGGDE